jgi:formylglycine-generating enzyme
MSERMKNGCCSPSIHVPKVLVWGLLVLALVSCKSTKEQSVIPPATTPQASAQISAVSTSLPPPSASVPHAMGSAALPVTSGSTSALVSTPPPPCPADMVLVGKFCIDRYEAFLRYRDENQEWVNHPHNQRPKEGITYYATNQAGKFPQGYISKKESAKACEASEKRLCSFFEWRRACQGSRWGTFPYGHRGRKGACNSGKDHLLSRKHGNNSHNWKYEDHFNDPTLLAEPGFLSKSGDYSECKSKEEVYDLVGNLHEWVSTSVSQAILDRLENEKVERRDQPHALGNGMFLGGFFSTTDQLGPGCFYTTMAHGQTYHDYSTGFRCCKSADLPKTTKKKSKRKSPRKNP